MAESRTTRWTCDLCGTGVSVKDGASATGWVKLSFEHPYVDRSFYDKHVCGDCAETIAILRNQGDGNG